MIWKLKGNNGNVSLSGALEQIELARRRYGGDLFKSQCAGRQSGENAMKRFLKRLIVASKYSSSSADAW